MSVLSTCSSSCDCGGLLEPTTTFGKPGAPVLTSFGASSPGAASTPIGSPRSACSGETSDAVCVFQSDDSETAVGQGTALSCGADAAAAGSRGSVLPSSAEFIMYEWKTRDCPLGDEEHDWSTCVFAHPGEKARRRTPRDRAYNALCCPDVRRRGRCPRGDACPFAHSVFEIHLHPARFRTKMCRDGTSCSRAVCFFAHTPEELRTPAPEDVAALEQRKAAQQLQAQQQQKAQQEQDLQFPQGGKGLAKPTAAPLLAAKLSAATRAMRVPGPAPAPVRRDEMANARIRVWQHLLSLRAQQEQADALRIAAESGAMLHGGSPLAHGLGAGLMGSGHDTPLFGSSPPTPLNLGAAVSAAMGPAACGLGATLPSGLDGFGLGDVALAPLQPLGPASGALDSLLGGSTLPLAPTHDASVAPLLGRGWQGAIGGSPPAVCQPALHGAAPFLPSFPLW